jgi:hypothetical protein
LLYNLIAKALPQRAGAGIRGRLGGRAGGSKQAHAHENVLHLLYDLNEKRGVCYTTCLLVREIIEDFESDYIGHGFEAGLFNLVGAYSKGLDAGASLEWKIAATCERYAKACDVS